MRLKQYLLMAGILALGAFSALPHAVGGQAPARGPDAGLAPGVQQVLNVGAAGVGVAPATVNVAAAARELRVTSALEVFSSQVTGTSDAGALHVALEAYYSYRASHPEQVRKPYLYFVDYGLDSRTPRGWVLDMDRLELVEGPFTVAHGRGSGPRNGIPTRFSNRSGAATSSLGLFLAAESYEFTGHAGGRAYSSVGLRLDGVSGDFNDAARARGVVVHGAPYVTASGSGRSEGCPALEPARARRLIPRLAQGALVFLYSPRDTDWVHEDPWANPR